MRHVVSRKHGPSAQPRRARIVSISSAGTFWLYGAAAALGTAWLACTMPETANKSLEEVQRLFA